MKNAVITILAVLLVLETGYMFMSTSNVKNSSPAIETKTVQRENNNPGATSSAENNRPRQQIIISKGINFNTTPMFSSAYQVVPGPVSAEAQKALTGFSIKTQSQNDGSMLVTFAPKDSEDQMQQYIVKKGQLLYFIEQTPADDKADSDKDLNYRDDYGIITDANGIVQ